MNSAEAVIRPAVITRRRNTGNSEDIIGKLNETMDGKFEMRVVGSWIYIAWQTCRLFFLSSVKCVEGGRDGFFSVSTISPLFSYS